MIVQLCTYTKMELNTLNRLIVWYMSYVSIKPFQKENTGSGSRLPMFNSQWKLWVPESRIWVQILLFGKISQEALAGSREMSQGRKESQ